MTQRWTTFFAAAVLVASLACGGSTEPDTKGTSSEPATKDTSSEPDSHELVPCEFQDEAAKQKLSQQYSGDRFELAEQGDLEAQLLVAQLLQHPTMNFLVEGNRFYRCAAEQGSADAQASLGLNYEGGIWEGGPSPNYTEAYRWYRLAAEQGDDGALRGLAGLYAAGNGVLQDDVEAARLYQEAAEKGNPIAQQELGNLYSSGHGVSQSDVLAYMWLNIAASRFREGNPGRTAAVYRRNYLAERLTPDQRAEAQRLAREWDEAHPDNR